MGANDEEKEDSEEVDEPEVARALIEENRADNVITQANKIVMEDQGNEIKGLTEEVKELKLNITGQKQELESHEAIHGEL